MLAGVLITVATWFDSKEAAAGFVTVATWLTVDAAGTPCVTLSWIATWGAAFTSAAVLTCTFCRTSADPVAAGTAQKSPIVSSMAIIRFFISSTPHPSFTFILLFYHTVFINLPTLLPSITGSA